MATTPSFLSIINNNTNTFITQQTVINNYPIITQQPSNNSNNKNADSNSQSLQNNAPLRRSKRKRKTINYNFNSNGNNLNRSELEQLSLDELLAKAMGSIRNLRWDRDNEWCRYCGSRGSPSFFYSPWGKKKLCYLHFKQWKKNELCLSIFDEPVSIDAPINKADCSETEYLINLLMECNECSDNALTATHNVRKRKKNGNGSDESEYDESNVDDDVTERRDDNMYLLYTVNDKQTEKNSKINELMQLSNALIPAPIHSNVDNRQQINGNMGMDEAESCEESDFSTHGSRSNESECGERPKASKANFRSLLDKIMPILPPKRKKVAKKDSASAGESFKCTQCRKVFGGKRGLRDHLRNAHSHIFKCYLCDKGFKTQNHLKTHMIHKHRIQCIVQTQSEVSHVEEKPFKCGKCGKKFKSLGYLHGHMDRMHVSEESKKLSLESKKLRPYKCRYCNRKFTLKAQARKHEKKMHCNDIFTQRPKDKHCPKKPLTSYFLYCRRVRGSMIKRDPGRNMTEVSKDIGRRWRALSETERRKYQTEANNSFKKYKVILAQYKQTRKYRKYEKKLAKWQSKCSARKRKQLRKLKKESARLEKMLQAKNEDNDSDSRSDSDSMSGSSSSSD